MYMETGSVVSKKPEEMTREDIQILISLVHELQGQIASDAEALHQAMEKINELNRRLYGARREKTSSSDANLLSFFSLYPNLFNEAEASADAASAADVADEAEEKVEEDAGPDPAKKRRRKKTQGAARLPEDLPREDVFHDLPEAERICPQCGSALKPIGEDVYEKLKIIPAQVIVERHHVKAYACHECRKAEANAIPVLRGPEPKSAVPGSFASPESLAWLAVEKYRMGAPLYRIEKQLESDGILLSRQTMSGWLIRSHELCLAPLVSRLRKHLLSYDVLHADETPVQVLHEPGKTASAKSYMWLYATGIGAPHPVIIYDYQPDRKGQRPREFLNGFQGWLQTDGYAGYSKMPEGIIGVGCAAHARRKFWEAVQAQPEDRRQDSLAMRGLQFYDALFALERKFSGLSCDARKQAREEQAVPLLDEFESWLRSQRAGKSKLGTAIQYSLSEWNRIRHYLDDGRIELSNNYAERCIRPFVTGRKNWLFAGTPSGAKASAGFYSIIETAKASGVDPYRYLVWVFTELPQQQNLTDEVLDLFLPWNAPAEARSHTSSAAGTAS